MSATATVPTRVDATARTIVVDFPLQNRTAREWTPDGPVVLGWQLFDPASGLFIAEGEWQPLAETVAPGQSRTVPVPVTLPATAGHYYVYVSTLSPGESWSYQRGEPFVLLDADVRGRETSLREARLTTMRSLRREKLRHAWRSAFIWPFATIWTHRSLIRAMVRRDVLVRYRGSAGDFLWTFLNPLLLMATYFFVFGVVLKTRFGADTSRTGFVLYFLAGMLPWLAFSEAVGRAPTIVIQNGNLVKKLVFPVETLPVNLVASGVITQAIGTLLFLIGLAAVRGGLPLSVFWFPVVFVPQVLFTMGVCWALAGLGVFFRDLGQIIGFVLTTLFFLTPICYPDTNLPPGVAALLTRNPIYILVRGYRMLLLEGRAPWPSMTLKLWLVSLVVFLIGYVIFHKLRRSFADVL